MTAARAADDKKAGDVVVLDMRGNLAVADWFVLASGTSTRQVKAIIDGVEEQLSRRHGRKPDHREGLDDLRWALLDYGELVVHVFLGDVRDFYGLERLWADSPHVRWAKDAVTPSQESSA